MYFFFFVCLNAQVTVTRGKALKKSRTLCLKNQEKNKKNKKNQLKSQEKFKTKKNLVHFFFKCFTPPRVVTLEDILNKM